MTENFILLICGIFFIMFFFGIAAILETVVEFLFPEQLNKLMIWLDIPTDDWEE